ncbi:MAG: HisA/HisF-related TIM barrel protein [Caldilineaceae bacterium]
MASLPVNLRVLYAIAKAVDVPIQFGGGLRTVEDIRLALELGAERVVIGTAAIENPSLVEQALLEWGPRDIVVGIDAKDGKVATHGWQQVSNVDAVDLGHRMQAMGVQYVVYTDISRDGMLTGVNAEMTARLGDITGLHVIASGGVAGIQDIERLKRFEQYNIEGVITGQAIYTGALDLRQAIALGKRPLARRSAGLVPYRRTAHGPEYLLLYNLFFEQWQFRAAASRPANWTWRRPAVSSAKRPACPSSRSTNPAVPCWTISPSSAIMRSIAPWSIIWPRSAPANSALATKTIARPVGNRTEVAWELLTETRPSNCRRWTRRRVFA